MYGRSTYSTLLILFPMTFRSCLQELRQTQATEGIFISVVRDRQVCLSELSSNTDILSWGVVVSTGTGRKKASWRRLGRSHLKRSRARSQIPLTEEVRDVEWLTRQKYLQVYRRPPNELQRKTSYINMKTVEPPCIQTSEIFFNGIFFFESLQSLLTLRLQLCTF